MSVRQAVPFFGVASMEASLRWYVDGLGFRMRQQWIDEGKLRWCWLDLDDASIMLQEFRPEHRPVGPLGQGLSIAFLCDDALALYRDARSRGIDAKRPFVGNAMWVTEMTDPDGYKLFFESATDAPEESLYEERPPTSHERASGQPWDASYQDGPAPWDIGAPQPAIARLASAGAFHGSVLDAGCGTGENTLLLATLGLSVLGVDVAETALAMARAKAAARNLDVEFALADALHLASLGRKFDTVLDSALFHTFDAEEQRRYAASLASAIAPNGTLYVLCFAEGEDVGPHPVSEAALRAAFEEKWRIVSIVPERLQTRFHGDDGAPAWLATIERR